jgi:hypothetical protein
MTGTHIAQHNTTNRQWDRHEDSPREKNDGNNGNSLTSILRKRNQKQTAASELTMAADPVAKRAALRSTPEKMKQQSTKIAINDIDKEKSVGLTEQQRKYQSTFVGLMAPSHRAGIHSPHSTAPLGIGNDGWT